MSQTATHPEDAARHAIEDARQRVYEADRRWRHTDSDEDAAAVEAAEAEVRRLEANEGCPVCGHPTGHYDACRFAAAPLMILDHDALRRALTPTPTDIDVSPDSGIRPLVALSPGAWNLVIRLLTDAGAAGVVAAVKEQLD